MHYQEKMTLHLIQLQIILSKNICTNNNISIKYNEKKYIL